MLQLISYDLNRPGQDYQRLARKIILLVGIGNYIRPLDSVWIVSSNLQPSVLKEHLRLDYNDKLIVTGMDGWGIYNFTNEESTWITQHRQG